MAIRDVLKRDAASLLKLVDRVDDLEKKLAAERASLVDLGALHASVLKQGLEMKEQLAAANAKIHDQDEAFETAKIGVSHLEAMYAELEKENAKLKNEIAEYKKAMTRHIGVPKSWVDEAIKQMDSEGKQDGEEGKPR